MLTMEAEKAKMIGLKVDPCAGGAAPPATKKGVTRKK
jgi:hypothetical protein